MKFTHFYRSIFLCLVERMKKKENFYLLFLYSGVAHFASHARNCGRKKPQLNGHMLFHCRLYSIFPFIGSSVRPSKESKCEALSFVFYCHNENLSNINVNKYSIYFLFSFFFLFGFCCCSSSFQRIFVRR